MRLHNKQRYTFFKLYYLLLVLVVLFDVVRTGLEGSLSGLPPISPIMIAVGLFFIYRGLPVFEFDSDGEVLIFTAKEPFLQPFSKLFFKHTEFPKRKLKSFKISSWPFRRSLILSVDSKEGNAKRIKVPISYLRKSEVRDLERSLRGTLRKNKGISDGGDDAL